MSATRKRPSTGEIERHYFERFRRVYELPPGTVVYGDKPDVMLIGARKIGIEITNFFLRSGSLIESEQRQRRLRAEIISKAQASYRSMGGKAIELTIAFDASNPITPARVRKLAGELVALARRADSGPAGQLDKTWFQAMPEIGSVYFNAREYPDATWRLNGVYRVGLMSQEGLADIVKEKEIKSTNYAPCDAYWLLVIVEPMDAAQEQEIRIDNLNLPSDVFEKIIVYKPTFEHVVEIK